MVKYLALGLLLSGCATPGHEPLARAVAAWKDTPWHAVQLPNGVGLYCLAERETAFTEALIEALSVTLGVNKVTGEGL